MNSMDLACAHWHVSSYSNSSDIHQCVEVAALADHTVTVRDSKDRAGAVQRHPGPAWRAFLDGVQRGEFDRQP